MKVIFPFADKKISYDCISCEATCCHVNNFLLINEMQSQIILKKIPHLKNFIREGNNEKYLYSGKKCWFLEDNICSIHRTEGADKKPISCQLYPLKFKKLNDNLIIGEYVPCPNFNIVKQGGIDHEDSKKKLLNYLDNIKLVSQNIEVSNDRLIQEEKFAKAFDEDFPYHLIRLHECKGWDKLTTNQKSMAEKIYWLYPQVRMQDELLQLPFKWSLNSLSIYAQLICDITISFENNIQNIYTITLGEFIKTIKSNSHIIVH